MVIVAGAGVPAETVTEGCAGVVFDWNEQYGEATTEGLIDKHESVTVPEYPEIGVIVMMACATPPGVTVPGLMARVTVKA